MTELLNEDDFYAFTKALRIDSKEQGLRPLGTCLLGSQQRLLDEMRKGLAEGVHEFVTLKSRQLGVSTMSLAIDMFQVYKHTALNGAIVTHDEGARDQFRTTLKLYRDGLDDEWQREVVDDNRNQLVFDNGSRLRFLVAGTRSKAVGSSKLGRSGALVLCHATECAFWGDGTGVDALRASFAQHNPLRLFHWESTANGENWFKQMWDDAKQSRSVRAIFVSWWANDFYGLARGTKLYDHYWTGRFTKEEREITRQVKLRYDWELNDCQWAWYRWMAAEQITDEAQMRQEYPHTEEDAFIATGSVFFRNSSLVDAARVVKAHAKHAKHYRMEFGTGFAQTRLEECKEKLSNLTVWAEPVDNAWYVIGVDPAYAANPNSNNSVVSVWRCWYNRVEQVAELVDRTLSTHAVAWAMTYLAGAYGKTCLNLEVNGPGQAVLQEYHNMRRQAYSGWEGDQAPAMRKVVAAIKQYLYRRPDNPNGAASFLHTKTTAEIKDRIMNGVRDNLERGILVPMSARLVTEMHYVKRDGGGPPEAPESLTDDTVIGAALAVQCWNDQLRAQLLANGIFYKELPSGAVVVQDNPVQRVVNKYLASIGMAPAGAPPPRKTVLRGQKRWSGKLRDRLDRAEHGRR